MHLCERLLIIQVYFCKVVNHKAKSIIRLNPKINLMTARKSRRMNQGKPVTPTYAGGHVKGGLSPVKARCRSRDNGKGRKVFLLAAFIEPWRLSTLAGPVVRQDARRL